MADKGPVAAKKSGGKPDLASLGGLVLALGGILGGLVMEGGKVKDVSQVTAAIIVLFGTIGAVMVTTPMDTLIEANAIQDPFLRKALNLAVDGTDLEVIRKTMELQISLEEHHAENEAKVFEAAGGYAPTIGIIGAVLGLIQVMKNLANIEEVGHGIAVAFVATVYGVASANIFFLPAGAKIKARMQKVIQNRELMLEGVSGIVEGLNPKLIRSKLEAYENHAPAKKDAKAAKGSKAPAQAAPAEG
jgi:chemotaxis protein MotA